MTLTTVSPRFPAIRRVDTRIPEQSLRVACLLCMSGGFLDAFTWLSFGGVFANSQTGNVVFLGMYAALGKWHEATRHIPPIIAFLAGAWVAMRVRAPLLCLLGEITSLATVMLVVPLAQSPFAIMVVSFGVALQSASFRQVQGWKYLTVTVTGNMLRGIEQSIAAPYRESGEGVWTMASLCLMFLLGTVTGGFCTVHLSAKGLIVPIGLQIYALFYCIWWRYRLRRT